MLFNKTFNDINSNRTLLYNMAQAKAKIIQFRVTEQDYAKPRAD